MSDKSGLPTGKHTLVEDGTEFKGTMSSKCPIVVMGKVEGDIAGPVIHITPSGVVAGVVKVKELRSDGELAGEVEADSVQISGRVRDRTTIRARTLEVSLTAQKGAMQVMFGECELAVGDEPNKEAAVAAALAPAPPGPPEPPKPTAAAGKGAAAPAATSTAESDEAAKRRRGTQPPPGTPSAS
ncbi:MAG TPA: polymer-forming cytoskeletal protein [Kofleriaceae bacterium]|nr:polymer-forming cytoskeletal protein [Kofleriaceae bacterium]